MNFISLGELVGVGVEIQRRKFAIPSRSVQEEETRNITVFSEAASVVHQAIHNARALGNAAPSWVEINKETGKLFTAMG